jgi:hypothetical protein
MPAAPAAGGRSYRVDPPARSDRLGAAVRRDLQPQSLVGSWFVTDGEPDWQGCVVAEPSPGTLLIEVLDGGRRLGAQQLVRIEDMLGWVFYDDLNPLLRDLERGNVRWHRRRIDAWRAGPGRLAEPPGPANDGHDLGEAK